MNHNCSDCGQAIPAGLAHIRSVSLQQLTLCGLCLELRRVAAAPAVTTAIPVQRRGGTLAERLAEAARA